MSERLEIGYVPLIDAAPLVIARELGFAQAEGLELKLTPIKAWAQLRDLLGTGALDAAHMLAPMPVAQALGLGPAYPRFDLGMMLSQGGQAVAVSARFERALREIGHGFEFTNKSAARQALERVATELRVGVPYPFSTQAELVRDWLDGTALALSIHTIPPHRMAEAMAAGEIDACCVGEPWASFAVEAGVGALLLAGAAIWPAPPEKGLVFTQDFAEARPESALRLIRAVYQACRWLDAPENRSTAAEILAQPAYLDLPPELCERGLLGRLHISAQGELRDCAGFIRFAHATAPDLAYAAFLASRFAARHGLPLPEAEAKAQSCYRADLHQAAVAGLRGESSLPSHLSAKGPQFGASPRETA